jgi:DegV family protein with EDD domain
MTQIAIVTDSTAYIPENLRKQHNIYVAPQQLIWPNDTGTETFRDGIDISSTQFFQRLRTDKKHPQTSQVSPAVFKDIFAEALKSNDAVLCIAISSGVSQTLNSAHVAKNDLPGTQIEIVDSRTTAMALGFLALAAAKAAPGKSLAELKQYVEANLDKTGVIFTVDTLDYLHKGGRIGGAQRFLGNLLNTKPVLGVKDGKVDAIDRVRTKKKAVEYVGDYVVKAVEGKSNIRLATLHADAEGEARELLDSVSKRVKPVESILSEVSPVVGVHAGPGTVGLAWMTD